MKIRFTPSGRFQFLNALSYIQRDDPQAAVRFRHRAEKVLRRLERYPESGRHLPKFPDLPFREAIVAPYRFFYKLDRKTVWIVAVWHGGPFPEKPG